MLTLVRGSYLELSNKDNDPVGRSKKLHAPYVLVHQNTLLDAPEAVVSSTEHIAMTATATPTSTPAQYSYCPPPPPPPAPRTVTVVAVAV